ncbi:MAG: hypothetical protein SPE10_04815 [Paludibacteraceae bacterium]|nr:hypothetical protein [Paludibacteraceae bacterium]
MAYDLNIREEELKNKVATDFFAEYDTTKIIGNVDFCIAVPTDKNELFEQESLLWAEAKKGNRADIYASLVQLILTIGKARTFDKFLPPAFLGAFDAEKIAFIQYNAVLDVFYQNDFNWNVTPSDHETKEFQQVYETVKATLEANTYIYRFGGDDKELHRFIKQNFIVGKSSVSKIRINKNNFTNIYNKWLLEVKPTISVNWEVAKKNGIIDADFYLADILSEHNVTLKEKLYVLLRDDHYELDRRMNEMGLFSSQEAQFSDKQKAHTQFWNRYNRPPKREYWDYIVERRDLLVPQDVRERKGSFFTPQIWVELSQQYIADVLGENWQDEYYVWDCCAGTGNLLAGLTNKYNIWASTLDQADVDVMRDRIKNGANLLDSHVFRFDFLNDDFSKLPQPLQEIINDPEKRRKLVIYINPPYAEATTATTVTGTGKNKAKVATENKIYQKYKTKIGKASNELFAQFFIRVYQEIPGATLAEFSKLKILQASNFADFRKIFRAKLERAFIVPADTFDNVKGKFPIGFFVWDTSRKEIFTETIVDAYNKSTEFLETKKILALNENNLMLNRWLDTFKNTSDKTPIGLIPSSPSDFQHNNQLAILSKAQQRYCYPISETNVVLFSIYFSVRQCIEATWLNDRDQFLYPNDGWQEDKEFQSDCLAFTLFHGQNRISCEQGVNHWIPFTEAEVDAKEKFDSHFMTDFIAGRDVACRVPTEQPDLFADEVERTVSAEPLQFSATAQTVMDAGRELWRYYHAQPDVNPNASLYDIRAYFQGRNEKGKMNNTSTDECYNTLIGNLRQALKELAKKIEPKVYEYGFLK